MKQAIGMGLSFRAVLSAATIAVARHRRFVDNRIMNAYGDDAVARIAAAIGEPARARMLYCLMDGREHTSTELALVAEISPWTASAHLGRLTQARLLKVASRARSRYYSLEGADVARALESLSVLAGPARGSIEPGGAIRLRAARSCYDHLAGSLGVRLRERLESLRWLRLAGGDSYELTRRGTGALSALGIDLEAAHKCR